MLVAISLRTAIFTHYGDFDFRRRGHIWHIRYRGGLAHLSFKEEQQPTRNTHAHLTFARTHAHPCSRLSRETPSYSTTHANRHTASTPDSPHSVRQPSRARLRAAHCPAARGSPHRAEKGSTGRVTEPNRMRLGRPSPSRSQAWTSIQIWTSIQMAPRSAALLSCVLPHPAPDAAVLPPLCHAPIHSPTTSSLVLPHAHGRLHEHARGTPAKPTLVPTLTTAVLTRAARRARSGPTCSPQVRAACDHPTQLSGAARGKQPTSAAGGRGRTVHQSARRRPST